MTKARDISKLSAVEADATADQTNTEVKAAVEAASDSNTFTDADHSKLNAIEASADVTDTANVTSSGALMDSELTNLAAVKAINQSLVTTASPTFSAVTANAGVVVDNVTLDANTLATSSGNFTIDSASDILLDADGGNVNLRDGGTPFGNFNKNGNNLKITSSIQDGDILLTGSRAAGTVTALSLDMSDGGAATFSSKIMTGNTTLEHTQLTQSSGNFVMDVAGNIHLDGAGAQIKLLAGAVGQFGNLYTSSNHFYIKSHITDKDLRFEVNDSGSDLLALKLAGDGGHATFGGNVGIGTSSIDGTNKLQVEETTANTGVGIKIQSASWDSSLTLANNSNSWELLNDYSTSSFSIYSSQGAAYRLVIDSSGKIQIGNNIPMWSGSYGGALFLKGNNATADRYAQLTIVNSSGVATTSGLKINNDGTATFGGTVGVANGTVGLPSLSFAGDPNTGLYRPSSDNLGFAIGATARAFMSNSQFNVDAKIVATELDINGNGDISGTLTTGVLSIPNQGFVFNQGFGTGVPTITMTGTANNGRGGAINFKESDGSGGSIANTAAIYSTDGAGGNATYGGLTIATYQGDMKLSTGGLASPRITILSGGNVGIGDTDPQEKFTIKGDGARMTISSADMEVAMIGRAGSSGSALDQGYLRLRNQGVTADGVALNSAGNSWINGGNVGIGLTGPSSKLVVQGGDFGAANGLVHIVQNVATNAPTLFIEQTGEGGNTNDNQGLLIKVDGNNAGVGNIIRAIGTNSNVNGGTDVEAFTVKNSGNVGIGTTDPANKLNVQTSSDVRLGVWGGTGYAAIQSANDANNTLKKLRFDASEYFFIGGNVGIGTTDPDALLHLKGGNEVAKIKFEVGTADADKFKIYASTSGRLYVNSYSGNTGVYLNYNGTSWSSNSDETLKDNITSLGTVGDKLKNYRTSYFNWKADTDTPPKRNIGFIAQDWETDFPEVVTKKEGETLGMQYTETIPILLKYIQELEARITILEA